DTPVKRYSSGMHVRLAFSVAVHIEPDIMLIDEVLAVGDISFQKKCLQKIHEVARRDQRTILFVSHNLDAVQSLCERSIYLERGQVKMIGETHKVVTKYLNHQVKLDKKNGEEFVLEKNKKYQILHVVVRNENGLMETNLSAGRPFTVEVDYEVISERAAFWIVLQCVNEHGSLVFYSRDTDKNPTLMVERGKGRHRSIFKFPMDYNLSLNTGRYFLTTHIFQDQTIESTIAISINDDLDKFPGHPGVLLIGEKWINNEQSSK
ncbi:MAG: hypothetical protein AAB866_00525, partial [Patescibacteria group bacterium]